MRIAIVGSGNVASNLIHTLTLNSHTISYVVARNLEQGELLAKSCNASHTSNYSRLDSTNTDVVLICVKDHAIQEVGIALSKQNLIIAHTSGSVEAGSLDSNFSFGVFYPLQTFTKGTIIDFKHVPLLVEGSSLLVQETLSNLANTLTEKVIICTSEERKWLHLAAVFTANFSTALIAVSQQILREHTNLDSDILFPLLQETIRKSFQLGALTSQTGPAVRNDTYTITKQLNLLASDVDLKDIYQRITELIQKQHRDKL